MCTGADVPQHIPQSCKQGPRRTEIQERTGDCHYA